MKTKLIRLAGSPRAGIAVEIEIVGEPVKSFSEAACDLAGSDPDPRIDEKSVETELRKLFETNADEIHVHRNRDGSYAYAVGVAPGQWPEDSDKA